MNIPCSFFVIVVDVVIIFVIVAIVCMKTVVVGSKNSSFLGEFCRVIIQKMIVVVHLNDDNDAVTVNAAFHTATTIIFMVAEFAPLVAHIE